MCKSRAHCRGVWVVERHTARRATNGLRMNGDGGAGTSSAQYTKVFGMRVVYDGEAENPPGWVCETLT